MLLMALEGDTEDAGGEGRRSPASRFCHSRTVAGLIGEFAGTVTDLAAEPLVRLTPREREVLELVGKGLSNAEVGDGRAWMRGRLCLDSCLIPGPRTTAR